MFCQDRSYTIETYAGSEWTGDGRSAAAAVLVQPQGLAVGSNGDVYIADAGDNRIRRVDANGTIRTVAGTGVPGIRGDGGPALQAQLNAPYGMAMDRAGNLFIADLGNACVRRLSPDGNIVTVAGGGQELPRPGSAIAATRIKLNQPRDVAVDAAGNLYIADFGAHSVYQVTSDGMLTLIAGGGEAGEISGTALALEARLTNPAAVAVDSTGTLFIADSGNHRVRRLWHGVISTLTDKRGAEIELGTPTGLEIDSYGRLYIADGSAQITVLLPTGDLMAIPLGGTSVAVSASHQMYSTSGRSVLMANGVTPVVFAGSPASGGPGDGYDRKQWRFTAPAAIVRDDAGALYIADTGNGRIRRLNPTGELTTLSSGVQSPVSLAFDNQGRLYAGDSATGGVYRIEPDGTARLFAVAEGREMLPAALAFDRNGNLFIADSENGLIRRVNSDGVMTVAAGGGSVISDGPALTVALVSPAGLAVDPSGVVWFTESGRLRRLTKGSVTTVTGPQFSRARGLRVGPDGGLVIADAGRHRVVYVSSDGKWTPLAGSGDRGLSGDGDIALSGMLNSPADVLLELDGSVLIADTGNNRIRRLMPATGPVEAPPPAVETTGVRVLHAATLKAQGVAPGQLVYISGNAIPAEPEVRFGGSPATVLAKSEKQLTVQVPAALHPGPVAVVVTGATSLAGKGTAEIVSAAPAVMAGSGGQALAANEDGQVNGPVAPAARGSIVAFYVTGEGPQTGPVAAEIGGYPAEVVWSGGAPGVPGLMQVNVRTPGGFAPSGTVPVTLIFGSVRTQSGVTISSR